MKSDYLHITELSGDRVSAEQVDRMVHRYYWAGEYCEGKDVLEVGCGTGQGLGYLQKRARSVRGGDYSEAILERAKNHYGDRVELSQFDAQELPYKDNSFDVVILFEAIYYVPAAEKFAKECRRVLRKGGVVLIATANKDLFDFNPSPQSHTYYGVVELEKLFAQEGFTVECFGYCSVKQVSWRQKVLRPVKKAAVTLGIMPKTADGKKFLKRLVFGNLVEMPAEVKDGYEIKEIAEPLPSGQADVDHKVIYCVATLTEQN